MQQPVFRVGAWLVTPAINQISKPGHTETLEPRLIDLLTFFAHHPDVVLSRDELIDNVWKRNIVTSHVVTQSISELRKSLKCGGEEGQEYIVTVPKRGYKLSATVVWPEEEPEDTALSEEEVPGRAGEEDALLADTEPVDQIVMPSTPALPEKPQPVGIPARVLRRARFWVWAVFFAALATCVILIGLATWSMRPPVTSNKLLLNPRDIDIRLVNGTSCSNWSSQRSCVVGISELISSSLNTWSTFLVHDKTDFNINNPSTSGKSLNIEFVNQRHYRSQQCFMSVKLIDNADRSVMLDKRYFITRDNQIEIQNDLLNNLSVVLQQPWPDVMEARLRQNVPSQGQALQSYFMAHQLVIDGDAESLAKASKMFSDIIKLYPDFTFAHSEKLLVDMLRHSQQPLSDAALADLHQQIDDLGKIPGMDNNAIYYQIRAVDLIVQGKSDDAYGLINKSIDLEMSWLNYVLLGKVYEMKGENRLAADAYITAFNLRPGNNTLYWIKNSFFQTSIANVVPWLDNFISETE
ncbi:CadC family transcriptional regulator [Shimwellia pseudoproteus]|uniref:lysine decarboxylation/transport transcriptional activator CadC n=1 Tax=Shimwellia pseudoproteus TaxID=570012 RepID=UPI0018EDA00B|nr:lysine decarboxylation/transport transcriptional activator CadC [Shimwellia pseudoproteus]MBJ3813360.1 CadC family transcriptional regulator [Shimwellia pseudoproteus]